MNNSILLDIKKQLGIEKHYDAFDQDIIIHINSIFSNLYQMGVVSNEGLPFNITSDKETWNDFNIRSNTDIAEIKSYMYLKVRLLFDPPTNSTLLSSMKEQADEFEWRMYIQMDTYMSPVIY